MIGATSTGSYAQQRGDQRVRVGIIDTGIDGTHPDIAPNFDRGSAATSPPTSPIADGPCEATARARTRPTSTTTATARTSPAIDRARRSTGSASPAWRPDVTLVNIRAGQDSGFFFLQPTVDALTYAARHRASTSST